MLPGDALLIGSPGYVFTNNTNFTVATPNPVADLDIINSAHLILGTLHTQTSLPVGTYTADVGIYISCTFNFCLGNPFETPGFADAGLFTINVLSPTQPVPEPETITILAVGLGGFAGVRWRRVRKRI